MSRCGRPEACCKLRAWIALTPCGLMLSWNLSPILAYEAGEEGRAGPSRQGIRIALFPVVNQSKAGGEELATEATRLLVYGLADRREFALIRPEEVQKAAPLVDLRSDLRVDEVLEVGKQAKADWVARFVITQGVAGERRAGKAKGGEGDRRLELHGEVLAVPEGHLAARVYARTAKPIAHQVRPVEAKGVMERAIGEALDQLIQLTAMRGVVGSKPEAGHVRISLGTADGLRPGAEVAFYGESGELIGYGKAEEVDGSQSLVRLPLASAFQKVNIGTRVRAVYNPPPYVSGLTFMQREDRKERLEGLSFLAGLASVLTAVYLNTLEK